jgi:hypothetical protein
VQELERLKELFPRRGIADTARLLRRSPASIRQKAIDLLRRQQKRGPWTADDEDRLRLSWGVLEPRLLGLLLGRSQSEVLRRVAALRDTLRRGSWSRAEISALKEHYGTRRDEDLEVCLQRPVAEIAAAAAELCLAKDKRFAKAVRAAAAPARAMPRWRPEEADRLRAIYPQIDNLEVARQLGRTVASVANKANQLGLKKAAELLARIGRANVQVRYAEHCE